MSTLTVSAAVEGDLDEVILRRLAEYVGFQVGTVYGRKGKPNLLTTLQGFNNAARFSPWIVLIDLDKDFSCAPAGMSAWLPQPAQKMHCRIAVREIEAWLLADRERIADMLSISPMIVEAEPDTLDDPKQYLVNLARRSNQTAVTTAIVPRPGSGRSVGPLYNAKLIEFVTQGAWRVEIAQNHSPSLRKTLARFRNL